MTSDSGIGPERSGSVSVVPGVNMLRVLSHLNYKPWFALGEFVDNAIQSYIADPTLRAVEVQIDIDARAETPIVIRDNSSGIRREDFDRAFKPATAPPDSSGLSEFGMGMKSAAYWFSDQWSVVTSVAGSDRAYSVEFDVQKITENNLDVVEVRSQPTAPATHFTEVRLDHVRHVPVGRTIGKIKDHLRDIYREFIDSGHVTLVVNGDVLKHKYPEVLKAPHFADPTGDIIVWRVDFDFEVAPGRRARGFAALRDPGSTRNTGLSLFRRGRIIEGSGDEGYMPSVIFGGGNSYESQRVFGDIHLEGFGVSHTKDGLQWDGFEDRFLELLRSAIDADERPLLRQAKYFRKFEFGRSARKNVEGVLERTANDVKKLGGDTPKPFEFERERSTTGSTTVGREAGSNLLAEAREPSDPQEPLLSRSVEFDRLGITWHVSVESSSTLAPSQWFSKSISKSADEIRLRVQLNVSHPFVIRFCQRESESLEAVVRMAVAMAVGEVLARLSGTNSAGAAIAAMNSIITDVLAGD